MQTSTAPFLTCDWVDVWQEFETEKESRIYAIETSAEYEDIVSVYKNKGENTNPERIARFRNGFEL